MEDNTTRTTDVANRVFKTGDIAGEYPTYIFL